jgi:2-iminobutanoate/2-iminopropanoate deaminase
MQTVETDRDPLPAGHYSQAIVHGGMVFVSGQLPIDPATGASSGESIEQQMEQAMVNVVAILEAAGSGLSRLLKVTVYLSDMSLWARGNAVYGRILGEHRPARAIVATLPLHYDYLVEIDAIAALETS